MASPFAIAGVPPSYADDAPLVNGFEVLAVPGTGRFVPRQHGGSYIGED